MNRAVDVIDDSMEDVFVVSKVPNIYGIFAIPVLLMIYQFGVLQVKPEWAFDPSSNISPLFFCGLLALVVMKFTMVEYGFFIYANCFEYGKMKKATGEKVVSQADEAINPIGVVFFDHIEQVSSEIKSRSLKVQLKDGHTLHYSFNKAGEGTLQAIVETLNTRLE